MTISVPIISLAGINDPEGRKEIAKAVRAAARNSGFMQIVDHGISEELVAEAFDVSKRVFALPLEEKIKYTRNPNTNRGWDALGGQALKGAIGVGHDDQEKTTEASADKDMKEGWMIGPYGVDESFEYWGRFGHGKNVFPPEEQVPGMEDVMRRYYDSILALATSFMKIVAISLDEPEETFDSLCRLPAAAIRLLHYPAEEEGTGAGAHADFGLITFLRSDGNPGLQLFSGGVWSAVEPAPGAFILNVGDILSLYTGGEYKSSLHRVENQSGVERYSIPFFLDGNSDILVAPTRGPGLGKFPAVTVEQHLRTKFDASYYDKTTEDIMKSVVQAPGV